MKLEHFRNLRNKEYEIIISGLIGRDVDGKRIAGEIRYLNSIGATKITERINSDGGDVVHGLDIVDANLNSEAIIETIVTGLAASTAGWIAASGTKGHRFIVDYGKAMMHNPQIGNKTLEQMPDGPDKSALVAVRDSIATILSNMSTQYKAEIGELMDNSTWFNAEAWIEGGFADHIISTNTKYELADNLSALELVNRCEVIYHNYVTSNINNNNNPKDFKKMKQIANYFKLDSEASEAAIFSAVDKQGKDLEKAQNTISDLTDKGAEQSIELIALKTQVSKFEDQAVVTSVESAIESGKFDEKEKEDLIKNAKAMGLEAFTSMVEKIKIPHVDVLKNVVSQGDGKEEADKTKEEKLAAEWQKLAENDPNALKELKFSNRAKYDEMFNAWNK